MLDDERNKEPHIILLFVYMQLSKNLIFVHRELYLALGHLSLALDQILEALDGSRLASVVFSGINPLQVF